MEHGLQNIFLHHSYFPSVLTKVSCNAHTNITGGNGAGKTTLLSLIPIFYGMEPSKMVSKAGDKKNFVGHYLPSPKSMIVFEYSRMGSLCCAVLYRNQQSLEYRFVQGGAEDVLFSEGALEQLSKYQDANQWLMQAVGQSTEVSKQIKTTKDYRAVIQNNKNTLRQKRQRGDSLLSVAGQFSLCDPVYEMKHIEAITSVLMKSDKLLAKFKTMIVDAFLADQIEVNASPYHKHDSEYIDNLRSLIELEKNHSEFEHALSKRNEIERLWSRLLHFRSLVKERLLSVSAELSSTQDLIGQKVAEQKAQLLVFGEKIETLSSEHHSTKGELTSLSSQIKRIYDKKDEWEYQRSISEKCTEVENRSSLRAALSDAETHYQNLLEVVKSERSEHDVKVSNVRVKAAKQREKLTAIIDDLKTQVSAVERETDRFIAEIKEKHRAQADEYREQRKEGELARYDAVSELRFKKKELTSLTQDEISRIDSIQSQLDEIEGKLATSIESLTTCKDNVAELQASKSTRLQQRQSLTQDYDNLLRKREDLIRRIEPEENSLRAYLNETAPDWHLSFGKIIRPELLDRKNLKPTPSESDNGIFGLTLDLEAVELTEEAQSVEVLKQKEVEISKDIRAIDEQLSELSSTIKQLDSSIYTATSERDSVAHQVRELERTKERLRLALKQERAAIETEKANKRKTIDQEISDSQSHYDAYMRETNDVLKNIEAQSYSTQEEYKVSQSDKLGELEDLISSNRAMIQDSVNSEKQRISDLNDAFSRLIENKGISASVERESKERYSAAKSRLELAESYVDEVADYRRWMDATWSGLQGMELKEAELKSLALQSESRLKEAKSAMKDFSKSSADEINGLKDRESELVAIKRSLSGVEQSLYNDEINIPANHPVAEALSDSLPVDVLISQSSETASLIKQTLQSIRNAVRKVEAILLSSDKKNKINDHWISIKDKIQREGFEESTDVYYLECAKGIDRLINTVIPDVKQLTVEQIRSVGEGYIRFYQTLDTLNSKVRSVSSILGREINTKNNFPDIGSITVELVSKVQEYAIWTELGAFSNQWEKWIENDRNALPDASFLSAFQRAIDGMKAGGIEGLRNARNANTIEPLIDVKISLVENNRLVVVRNDQDLEEASSEGLSKLAIIIVFCGATRYLCPDPNARIHWPLDELGKISNENVSLLFEFMDSHNINLFCAQPNPNEVLRKFFPIKCEVIRGHGIRRYRPKLMDDSPNPLLSNTSPQEA